MTEDETRTLMERYGITVTQQTVYLYGGFKYGNLEEALDYATLVRTRANEPAGVKANETMKALKET